MKIHVMVNGLPGRMAMAVAKAVTKEENMQLVRYALTGEEVTDDYARIDEDTEVKLIKPSEREMFDYLFQEAFHSMLEWKPLIMVDFTSPESVNRNVKFYADHGSSSVIGTTGGDMERLIADISGSSVNAVVAPNMAVPIVIFQAMIKYAADNFPGAFEGSHIMMSESHQSYKKDKSGVMRALIPDLIKLGINTDESRIYSMRNPAEQLSTGIPREFLDAHAWHTYDISGKGADLSFTHNICGREIYAAGTIKAIEFIFRKSLTGQGKIYSMTDVLKDE
jgi:4-hydroxy-tetrahydrodipicolinate reductase